MKKEVKTNAMRLLDKAKIKYETLYYDLKDQKFSGEAMIESLGLKGDNCFKTLALKHEHDLFVVCVPVNKEIDLKKCAKELSVKSLEMVKVKDLFKEIGYERGSCTPIGIKKRHRLVFDVDVNKFDEIEISGGMMGIALILNKDALLNYLKAEVKDVCL